MQASARKHNRMIGSDYCMSLLGFQVAPEEYIYRAGEIANEMFLIVSGSVDELSDNPEVHMLALT